MKNGLGNLAAGTTDQLAAAMRPPASELVLSSSTTT